MKQKILILGLKTIIYLRNIKASNANSGLPLGPALGQYGIPAAPFCKDFNERSKLFIENTLLQVEIRLLYSGEYIFNIMPSTLFFFIKKIIKLPNFKKIKKKKKKLHLNVPLLLILMLKNKLYKKVINKFNIFLTPYILYEILIYIYKNKILFKDTLKSMYLKCIGTLNAIKIHLLLI